MTTKQKIRDKLKNFALTSEKIDFFDPNLNDQATLLFKFKNGDGNKYRLRLFTKRMRLETPLATSLLFSVNIPDKVCMADKLLKRVTRIGQIFTNTSNAEQVDKCIKLLNDDLIYLNFKAEEGLNIYNNWLQLTLDTERKLHSEIAWCEKIKTQIEMNFPEAKDTFDYLNLPNDFRGLVEKFSQWAISDDFEREEKRKSLTLKQRKSFVTEMEPKLEEINNFLDGFKNAPLTDGAIRLQTLAELFTELTIGIEKKNYN